MGTRYDGTDAEKRALCAYINLMRAAESVTARTSAAMSESGLTTSQFGTLEALLHLGPICQKELGEKLLKTGGNIVMVVDNLEKRGLVRRVREEKDRRFITVHLTEPGRKLIRRVFPRVLCKIAENMRVLSHSDQEVLRDVCRRLGRQEKR